MFTKKKNMSFPVAAPWRAYCGYAFFILCLFLLTASAQAAERLVPSQYPTIQAAIDNAAVGDTVLLADGTYTGAGNKNLDFGGKDITVRSASGDPTRCILDCQGSGRGFLFQSGETAAASVAGLTIQNGNLAGEHGGGIYLVSGSPTITQCIFAGNTAALGGGVAVSSLSSATITHCLFTGNTASNISGDEMSAGGGGMYIGSSGATITHCTFVGNTAIWGGGMVVFYLYNPTVANCTFLRNTAAIYGGGLYFGASDLPMTLANCTFAGNTAGVGGGGIYNYQNYNLTLANCTFTGNTAGYEGGGIYNVVSFGGIIANCTFAGNTASLGDGIYNFIVYGSLVVTNSILWDYNYTYSYSFIFNFNYCDIRSGSLGEGSFSVEPLFVRDPSPGMDGEWGTEDDDYGDLHLQPGSPCLNVGSNAALPPSLTTDLDGNPRIAYGTVDLGAYETPSAFNVTSQVQVIRGGFRRNAATGRYIQTVTLKNISANIIPGPVSLTLDNLSSNAALYNKTGTTSATSPAGSPYLNTPGSLAPGASVTLTLEFTNPTNGRHHLHYSCPRRNGSTIGMAHTEYRFQKEKTVPSRVMTYQRFFCLLALLFCLFTTVTAQAAYLQVPSEYPTIQEGINASAPGDVVVLAGGTYTGPGNKNLDFGGKDITVRFNDFNPYGCVIDCEGSGRGFIFQNGETAAAAVENITIQNADGYEGGGIVITNSSPTIFNCNFTGNKATRGGGIYITNGSPTLSYCNFTGNQANGGGGIFSFESSPTISKCFFIQNQSISGGGLLSTGTGSPTLTQCNFYFNRADAAPTQSGGQGGAIYSVNGSDPTVTDCFFTENWATRSGGAIAMGGRSPSFTDCHFTSNQSNGPGGGIDVSSGSPTFTNCTFFANRGSVGGGMVTYSTNSTLKGCAFTGNLASIGGGLYLFQSNSTITNSTFTANLTGSGGGGMALYASGANVTNTIFVANTTGSTGGGMLNTLSSATVTNCTFSGNQARSDGGGMYSQLAGNVTVINSILWGNIGGEVAGPNAPTITYSNVQGGYSGIGNLSADPLFVRNPSPGPDQNVGSGGDDDFGDLRLQTGSPCLDTGSNAALPLEITTDLDTNLRIVRDTVDQGAYEFQVAVNVTTQVQVTRGGFRRNATTGRYTQTVTLKNIGASAIPGPISLVLNSLSSNTGLYNKTGTTSATNPTGSPYKDTTGSLAPGVSVSLTLEFTNPTNAAITYTTRVLAGTGTR